MPLRHLLIGFVDSLKEGRAALGASFLVFFFTFAAEYEVR